MSTHHYGYFQSMSVDLATTLLFCNYHQIKLDMYNYNKVKEPTRRRKPKLVCISITFFKIGAKTLLHKEHLE